MGRAGTGVPEQWAVGNGMVRRKRDRAEDVLPLGTESAETGRGKQETRRGGGICTVSTRGTGTDRKSAPSGGRIEHCPNGAKH